MNALFSICLMFLTFSTYGQWEYSTTSKMAQPAKVFSNVQLYKVEYELTDESNLGDSTILNSINMERFEYVQKQATDVIFYDRIANLEILIYSSDKVRSIKYRKTPTLLENQ